MCVCFAFYCVALSVTGIVSYRADDDPCRFKPCVGNKIFWVCGSNFSAVSLLNRTESSMFSPGYTYYAECGTHYTLVHNPSDGSYYSVLHHPDLQPQKDPRCYSTGNNVVHLYSSNFLGVQYEL